ncbi:MAG: hypothetical protein LH613_12180 [Chamaesiphon sp.]|nr:hypothetical protein [Chamaesiphon sp.]
MTSGSGRLLSHPTSRPGNEANDLNTRHQTTAPRQSRRYKGLDIAQHSIGSN